MKSSISRFLAATVFTTLAVLGAAGVNAAPGGAAPSPTAFDERTWAGLVKVGPQACGLSVHEPKWQNITPYIVMIDKAGKLQRVIGPPDKVALNNWLR